MKEKCDKHEDELYRYYCLDCKTNFCDKCMKTRIHKRHKKENIYDWYPNEEDLQEIEERIENYNNQINNLKAEKEKRINELTNILNNDKMKESKRLEETIKTNKKKRKE